MVKTLTRSLQLPDAALLFSDSHFAVAFLPNLGLVRQVPPGSWPVFQPLAKFRRNRALHRALAEIEPTPKAIADFLERGGFDLMPAKGCIGVVHAPTGYLADEIIGLRFPTPGHEELRREILAMKRCVALWEMIRKDDAGQLRRHVRWQMDAKDKFVITYCSHPDGRSGAAKSNPEESASEVILSQEECPEFFKQISPGDLVAPAILYLQSAINKHLLGNVTSRMLGIPKEKKLDLHTVPLNLIGGLWLQFAEEVSGDKEFRSCEQCHSWFPVSSSGQARKDKRFCSGRCRTNAYRRRKDAADLQAEGKSVSQIARLLCVDVKTVRGWLSPQGKEK